MAMMLQPQDGALSLDREVAPSAASAADADPKKAAFRAALLRALSPEADGDTAAAATAAAAAAAADAALRRRLAAGAGPPGRGLTSAASDGSRSPDVSADAEEAPPPMGRGSRAGSVAEAADAEGPPRQESYLPLWPLRHCMGALHSALRAPQ
mmetsp:Transcript_137363/g.342577  ORF Transcript_137363/g.342577 Transcript_137363/m.342577 type:complete len:153 (-) Transcript_137363:89-547(-)